mmetsp:Transcript_15405/g.60209  ORF Transcript_15405/g.60209 Transcript_15405/m.60209 type:complete len:203 (+) Transcript_15405:620-1228(+)
MTGPLGLRTATSGCASSAASRMRFTLAATVSLVCLRMEANLLPKSAIPGPAVAAGEQTRHLAVLCLASRRECAAAASWHPLYPPKRQETKGKSRWKSWSSTGSTCCRSSSSLPLPMTTIRLVPLCASRPSNLLVYSLGCDDAHSKSKLTAVGMWPAPYCSAGRQSISRKPSRSSSSLAGMSLRRKTSLHTSATVTYMQIVPG